MKRGHQRARETGSNCSQNSSCYIQAAVYRVLPSTGGHRGLLMLGKTSQKSLCFPLSCEACSVHSANVIDMCSFSCRHELCCWNTYMSRA